MSITNVQTRSSNPSVTPTVTSGSAYSAGQVVGGLLQFANAVDDIRSGVLMAASLATKSVQTTGFKLYLFSAQPAASTFTDKTAPSVNAADAQKLIAVLNFATADSGLGTHTLYSLDGIGRAFVLPATTTTLYGVLVTVATPTFTSTSDVQLTLNILKD